MNIIPFAEYIRTRFKNIKHAAEVLNVRPSRILFMLDEGKHYYCSEMDKLMICVKIGTHIEKPHVYSEETEVRRKEFEMGGF